MESGLLYYDIEQKFQKLAVGEIFDNSYFDVELTKATTLTKYLSTKVEKGQLTRFTKGKYYKPKNTIFGTLMPNSQQLIKSITHQNGKTIGYITGTKAYQERRLTTQLPNIIVIAIQGKSKPKLRIGNYQFKFVKRHFDFTNEQIPLLQLLDALKDIKRIPDASVSETIQNVKEILREMNTNDVKTMVQLAQYYPLFVKALLGAIVQEVQNNVAIDLLFQKLNPLTFYKIGIKKGDLKYQKHWKIC